MTKRAALNMARQATLLKPIGQHCIGETFKVYGCRRCGAIMSLGDGCEPTALCHHCAQEVAEALARYVLSLVRKKR